LEEKDAYQIRTSMNDGIIEIVVTGKVTIHNVCEFQKETNSIRATKGEMILLDVRALTDKSLDSFYPVRRPEIAIGKTAVVDYPEYEYLKSSWESIAKTTPMKIKWFSNIKDAKEWLKIQD